VVQLREFEYARETGENIFRTIQNFVGEMGFEKRIFAFNTDTAAIIRLGVRLAAERLTAEGEWNPWCLICRSRQLSARSVGK
jgi:hypothetical protein